MSVEKIQRQPSPDDVLRRLREVVPEAFADGLLDLARLRAIAPEAFEAGTASETDGQSYGLAWPGKQGARRLAYHAPRTTLRPVVGAGVSEATTGNVVVVGDNLQVMLALQKSYAGSVKLVYVDPPYNTGKDRLYEDDFSDSRAAYLRATDQADAGGVLVSNPKSGGRFHSRWLSMMLPRLLLARSLLREDGLLAVSIDDHEAHNLRLVLDEVFGEQNFVAQVVWHTEGHTDNQRDLKVNHEYIVLYARDVSQVSLGAVVDPSTRAESNVWKGFATNSVTKNGPSNPASELVLPAGFPCSAERFELPRSRVPKRFFAEVADNGRVISRETTTRYAVKYPVRIDAMRVRDGRLAAPCRVFGGWANREKLLAFIAGGCRPIAEPEGTTLTFYLSERGAIYYRRDRHAARHIVSVWQNQGTTQTARAALERDGIVFQYPKPVALLQHLIRVAGVGDGDLVLDVFAGSGTTGEAVMRLNQDDGLARRFMLIQLPELARGAQAEKAGVETIDAITCARLRSVAESLRRQGATGDCGFVVLREDAPALARGAHLSHDELASAAELSPVAIRGLTPDELIAEVLLLLGFPLDARREEVAHESANRLTRISHARVPTPMLLCLDTTLADGLLDALGAHPNHLFVCRDEALTDTLKARIHQLLRRIDSRFQVL